MSAAELGRYAGPDIETGVHADAGSGGSSRLRRGNDLLDVSERAEHLANVLRLRKVTALAILLWFAAGLPLDVLSATYLGATLSTLAAIRLSALMVLVPACLALYRQRPPSRLRFLVIDLAVFSVASICGTALCAVNGGMTSPYTSSLVCILIVRGVTLPEPWRRGLVLLGVPSLVYPLTMLALAGVAPTVEAQLATTAGRAAFAANVAMIAVAWCLLVVGGHVYWSLRRELFRSRTVGRYRLRERIGRGAMGEVWRARHAWFGRDVAIKVLRLEVEDSELRRRFDREVLAMSRLEHPNNVQILDSGITEDGLRYYAMELLEGETLWHRVHATGPVEATVVADMGAQIASALAEAHRRGIVHRDVTPRNIFLATTGDAESVKVLDYGLAHLLRGDPSADLLTETGMVVGTPAFLAPEQAIAGHIDARTDIYALGATLYFALTGFPPFERFENDEYLRAHVSEEPTPPSAHQPVPIALERVVLRCLRKLPEDRYATSSDLAAALTHARAATG